MGGVFHIAEPPSAQDGSRNRDDKASSASLLSLPGEVTALILGQLSYSTLLTVSLVCRSLDTLVKPFLFRNLSLGARNLACLSRMYLELIHGRPGERTAPLHGIHVDELSMRLDGVGTEDPHFAEKVNVQLSILNTVKSVKVLMLHIRLSIREHGGLRPEVASAISCIVESSRGKVGGHKLYLESARGFLRAETIHAVTARNVNEIYDIYSREPVIAAHFSDVHLVDFPSSLQAKLSDLRELSIQGGSNFFATAGVLPRLSTFSFAWHRDSSSGVAKFQTALDIINVSSTFLRRLKLRNTFGQEISLPEASGRIELAQLRSLDIIDTGIGKGSTFQSLLTCTKLPTLHTLRLQLTDIISLARQATDILSSLPAIKDIELVEQTSDGSAKQSVVGRSMYETLEAECLNRQITLRTLYATIRCESRSALQQELARIALLSGTLSQLDIFLDARPLTELDPSWRMHFPLVRRINLRFQGEFPGLSSHMKGSRCQSRHSEFQRFLSLMKAPLNQHLSVECSIDENSASNLVEGLVECLRRRFFPNLQKLSGIIFVGPPISLPTAMEVEVDLIEACKSVNIDFSDLRVNVRPNRRVDKT